MNILYISENFPPYDRGGAEISTSLIAQYASKFHRCFILTGQFQSANWDFQGIPVFPKLSLISQSPNSLLKMFVYGLSILFSPVINIFIITKFILQNNIDIVHFVPTEYYYAPLIAAAIITRRPFIVDVRNYALVCPSSLTSENCAKHHYIDHRHCLRTNYKTTNPFLKIISPLFAGYEYLVFKIHTNFFRLLLKTSSRFMIVPNSQFVKNILTINGYPQSKMQIIYNIINQPATTAVVKKNQIAFAGQFDFSKGIWNLIRAFEKLNPRYYTLELAGDGKQMPAIRQYILDRHLTKIHLLGYLPNPQVQELYRQSKIVAAPSIWPEPFGRFILESISAGTPLVTTSVGGTPEGIVNQSTGMLVNPDNDDQLAHAIDQLITDQQLYSAICSRLPVEAAKYQADFIGQQRINLYQSLSKATS